MISPSKENPRPATELDVAPRASGGARLWVAASVLLFVTLLAYGILVWQLGFYWDDLPISWIRYQLGPEALRVYFSTSRPVWGELYQLTTRMFPQVPVYWQVVALFWRWLGALILWQIVQLLWPARRHTALLVALAFLLYPGFNQQWVSFLSTHFFIVLAVFLLSVLLMLRALVRTTSSWLLTAAALLLAAANVWMLEFFFSLELIRPFLIAVMLRQQTAAKPLARRAFTVEVFRRWSPYLAVFVANVLYRIFVFSNVAYENVLLVELKTDPLGAVSRLVPRVVTDLWRISTHAWGQVFYLPRLDVDGPRTAAVYALVVVAVLAVALRSLRGNTETRGGAWTISAIGLAAMVLGGGPYWLADLDISLAFPANRFTISFAIGVSLVLAGLLGLLPYRARLFAASLLIALAAGRHFLWSNDFRRDWDQHKELFWQLTWRAPEIERGTIIMINQSLDFYADNSLGAALNWIYAPDNHTTRIDYVLFFPTNRIGGSLPLLESDIPVTYPYIASQFNGNTSRTLAFYYDPPACLRLLDPGMDPQNRLIPFDSLMRQAAELTDAGLVLPGDAPLMPAIYGPEPPHTWCYHFERAELARQVGDWDEVVRLADEATKLDDYPNDPLERFVYIEGFAHVGRWQEARQFTRLSYDVSERFVGPLLCMLWDRIDSAVQPSAQKDAAVEAVRDELACP